MSQNVSLEHTVARINGHEIEGWAAVADALLFPDNQLANYVIGPDGTKSVSSTAFRGGEITFKLLANSPSTKFFFQQLARIQRGAVVEFSGTITNTQTGASVRLERGHMQMAPMGQTLGNDTATAREFVIHFESILPNYDGVQTTSRPTIQ